VISAWRKILAHKLIRGNDTQFMDFAAIFIRKNICVYGISSIVNFPSGTLDAWVHGSLSA
jgi:hypothetical protein